ncbi:DUF4158 domain-containing protein [Streptomyces sp. NPDC001139]
MAAKGARNRLGWAVQFGTVRYLGTFLDNPQDGPDVVVDYVAEQLGCRFPPSTGSSRTACGCTSGSRSASVRSRS